MNAREGTKRKDACLNAESSITCSQTPGPSPANLRTLRCRLFLFEIYIDRLGLSTTSRQEKFSNSTETEHLRAGQRVCFTVSRPVSVSRDNLTWKSVFAWRLVGPDEWRDLATPALLHAREAA
jgi:hypothetical protein